MNWLSKPGASIAWASCEKAPLTKIEYIHNNPMGHKLVEEPGQWLCSGWHNYCLDNESILRIDRAETL